MAKALSPVRLPRSSRRPSLPRAVPVQFLPESEPEPDFDPTPVLDLGTVTLPDWLTPTLRDLMHVAERTFGYGSGDVKKRWVREALLDIVMQRELREGVPPFAPESHRRVLLDLLIEGVWSLHFRGRGGLLAQAIARVDHVGKRLRRARE